ncbi:Fungal specific transcription factor domain-containing protein 10 [Elsinoe fawcettii]|nr:Fungal specific transcription factor domain-containing protein 10 [Elsinoe fawcettii]
MSDNEGSENHAGYLLRACEHCRQRKIKCDRKVPCSSCKGLRIECKPSQKPTAPRTRTVSIAPTSSDKHMLMINQRLASIEASLKKLTVASAGTSPRIAGDTTSSVEDSPHNAVSTFDGESSFEVQTAQASEAANRTAAAVLGSTSNSQLKSVLSSLITSLEAHNIDSRSHESFLSPADAISIEPLALPPIDFISAVVRKTKTHPPIFLASFVWRTIDELEQLCQRCYFPSSQLATGSRTLLFGLLYFTLRDYVHIKEAGFEEQDISPSLQLCELNFYRSVESYITLTVPTFENIQSLLFAACRAQEESKMHLVWTYLSAAATMCHTIGLHRKASLERDAPNVAELKRQVFWNLYMAERNISLILGRKSNFRDDDIDQAYFSVSEDPRQRPWDQLFIVLIQFGMAQGRTYDELYSHGASRRSVEERKASVRCLAAFVLNTTEHEIKMIRIGDAWYPEKLQAMLNASDAMAYTGLTTIYRAQTNPKTSTEISSECFAYARLALEAHVRYSHDFHSNQILPTLDYVTWILLYHSFTPFVIHFTRTISTLDPNDLALLSQAVDMLDHVKHVSKGSRRMYNVSKAFYDTAEALVKTQQAVQGLQQHDDGSLMFTDGMDPQAPTASSGANWAAWSGAFASMDRNADMSMFLGNWLGDGKSVFDMLGLEELDAGVTPMNSMPGMPQPQSGI